MNGNEEILARSQRNNGTKQTYSEHVNGVKNKSLENVEAFECFLQDQEKVKLYKKIINNAAEYHDLGKLNKENQSVFLGERTESKLPIDHRDAGVNYLLGDDFERIEATMVYAHHYPGLPNIVDEKVKNNPFRFANAIDDTKVHLNEYLDLHKKLIGTQSEKDIKNNRWKSMEYRMLLSCLVDADYTDASGDYISSSLPCWEKRLSQLDSYVEGLSKKSESNERNHLRKLFYDRSKNADTNNRIEYCDSPVGSGKTTSIMAHMLNVALKHNLRHIIIVLPYTNIISQTVQVLRKAIVLNGENAEEIVAEHHHQVEFENEKNHYLATTWKAPVIVTTAVQFFETLASNQPTKLRKLCQLPGSAIIFDEYHAMLPAKFMLPAWMWINDLTNHWGCRVCMSSATSNKIWDIDAFKFKSAPKVTALLKSEEAELLKKLEKTRVKLNFNLIKKNEVFTLSKFVNYLDGFDGSKVVVFNTVKNAAYFADYLRKNGYDVLHLSSALTPEDREKIIDEINWRLDPSNNYPKNWILSTTSCVECGLNFSFNYGFCELRSIQSAIQLSGRVNRGNEFEYAELIVFRIRDDNFTVNRQFEQEIAVFERLLESEAINNIDITELVTIAFEEAYKMKEDNSVEIINKEKCRAFESVANNFQIIDDYTITVAASQKLVKKIQSGVSVSATEFQRGSVNVSKSQFNKLELLDEGIPFLSEEQYDTFLGYMKTLV